MSSNPHFSSILAWLSPLSTMHSAVTPPYFFSRSFSIEPEFTPMRTGTWCCLRQSARMRTFFSPPMLPGLMRTFAMPFSIERTASR